MTIPTLQQNISEEANISALKKAHSTFENAFRLAVLEYGTPDNWSEGAPIDVADGAEEKLLNKFSYSMRVLKNCGIKTDCLPQYSYKLMNGGPFTPFNNNIYAKAQLADGMLFAVDYAASDCSAVVGTTTALKNMCGYIMVDVNGHKKPNMAGKDYFAFYLTKYGIIPIGTQADTLTNYKFEDSCKSSGSGWGCTAWALYNGNMDYYKCNDLSWTGQKSCK